MNSAEFIKATKVVAASALTGLIKAIEKPPGRTPAPSLVRISDLFHRLSEDDRKIFGEALELAAGQATDNFLLILDGALAIESGPEKGELELYYKSGTDRVRLNDPEDAPLNEIFRGSRAI